MSTGIRQYFNLIVWLPSRLQLAKQASQQSAKKRKQYTNFPDTNRAEIGQYAAIIVTMRVLEGGAKIGTTHLQK